MSKSTRQRWHADVREASVYDEDGTMVVALAQTRQDCRRIIADHNVCLGIVDPATTVPKLVEVARRACGTCVCHATMRPDIVCLSCMARAVLAKTGQKP